MGHKRPGFLSTGIWNILFTVAAVTLINRYLLALLVFNLAACSSMQAVSVESAMHHSPPPGVDYGSLVTVKTLDKRLLKFRVTEITQEGLGGSRGFVRYADMDSLKVRSRRAHEGNTLAFVLGLLGFVALIALVASADSVAVCSNAPCNQPQP